MKNSLQKLRAITQIVLVKDGSKVFDPGGSKVLGAANGHWITFFLKWKPKSINF